MPEFRMLALIGFVAAPLLLIGCNRYNYRGMSYPAYAKAGGSGSSERYTICHKDRNALTLPESAIPAHLNHGDNFGLCNQRDRQRHDNHVRQNRGRRNSGR